MFKKKKKTYIDKINFDVFTDENDINEYDVDTQDYESENETEDDSVKESEDEPKDRYEKKKKKKSKGKIAFWIILWLLLFGAGICAFLYFNTDLFDKIFNKNNTDNNTTTEIATNDEPEIDESFKTIYSYETNANIDINALMADYYDALVNGDKDKLKDIVTEPDAFGDMVLYETKSQVINEYSNITCYTIPGLNENEILVFTTSNLNITGVNCKPLDIQRFYVVDTGSGYKINNGVLSQETIDYINLQTGSPDVQALYKSVQDNINQCLSEDSTFADFMNKISTNTDAY